MAPTVASHFACYLCCPFRRSTFLLFSLRWREWNRLSNPECYPSGRKDVRDKELTAEVVGAVVDDVPELIAEDSDTPSVEEVVPDEAIVADKGDAELVVVPAGEKVFAPTFVRIKGIVDYKDYQVGSGSVNDVGDVSVMEFVKETERLLSGGRV